MASGNKYKSLSIKLYRTLDDLKQIMKAQNTWQNDEINKIVIKNLKKTELDLEKDEPKSFKKQDFQRATTYTGNKGRRSEFVSSRMKQPSKIMEEEYSQEDSSESQDKEDLVANEDKILNDLFRTNVFSVYPVE